jgi:hypothetical protein
MPDRELVEKGKKVIAGLQLLQLVSAQQPDAAAAAAADRNAWKQVLEDLSAKGSQTTHALWAAIKSEYGGVLRTPYGVLVGDEALVMQLFRDSSSFSVREYWDRMDKSLGQGYLGMDPEPQALAQGASDEAIEFDKRYRAAVPPGRYAKESEHANPQIFAVSWQDAFELAQFKTKGWLDALAGRSPDKSNIALSLEELVADVFAGLAKDWFGIPQTAEAPAGRTAIHGLVAAASYIFPPHPTGFVRQEAGRLGGNIAAMAAQYVRDGRDHPALRQQAIVSGPLFDSIDDDERLARTIGGITQGFVAPTRGSFLSSMLLLIKTGQLWRLQQTLQLVKNNEPEAKKCAEKVIRPALVQCMRAQPAPDIVHRTAIRDIELGHCTIKAGERVVLGIIAAALNPSASTEVLFGGDYGKARAPVHSCPGQPMAMGALMGMISAILEAGTLQPAPGLLMLKLSRE